MKTLLRFWPAALLAVLALVPACVMPGTSASVFWNPDTRQFEGHLTRSWLSGPVEMALEATNPDGTRLSLHWYSEVSLKDATDASKAQMAALQAAAQAGIELGKAAALPIPK